MRRHPGFLILAGIAFHALVFWSTAANFMLDIADSISLLGLR